MFIKSKLDKNQTNRKKNKSKQVVARLIFFCFIKKKKARTQYATRSLKIN